MPTMAPPPPAAALNHGFGQCSSSPTKRRMVMPRVIKAGIVIRLVTEIDFVSSTRNLLCLGLYQVTHMLPQLGVFCTGFRLGARDWGRGENSRQYARSIQNPKLPQLLTPGPSPSPPEVGPY